MNLADSETLDALFKSAIGAPPLPYQRKLFPFKNHIVNKSRRTGISTTLAFKATMVAISGETALLVSPSERQSIALMTDYVERFLKSVPESIAVKLIEDSKSVKRFEGGGAIYSLPNNASTIRGFTPKYIALDEAAHFLNGTDKQVWEAVFPMLALGGSMDLVSTPFGEGNLFFERWQKPGEFVRLNINWRERPDLAKDMEKFRKEMDETTFSQEFENEFRGEVDTEFPLRLIETCVDPESDYEVNAEADVAGFDVGRRRDLSAICLVRREEENKRLVEKHVWRSVPFEEQKTRALEIARRVGLMRIDEGGLGMDTAEWLQGQTSNIEAVSFTNESKTEMFLNLKRLFEQKRIRIPMDITLIRSLRSIRRYYNQGRVILDAERTDETGHADEATALALACQDRKPLEEASIILADL